MEEFLIKVDVARGKENRIKVVTYDGNKIREYYGKPPEKKPMVLWFMVEKKLRPFEKVEVYGDGDLEILSQGEMVYPSIEYMLFFDIETFSPLRIPTEKDRIITISMDAGGRKISLAYDDESRIINEFNEYIRKFPIVFSFNGDGFDLPFIRRRADMLRKLGYKTLIDVKFGPNYSAYMLNKSATTLGIHVDLLHFCNNYLPFPVKSLGFLGECLGIRKVGSGKLVYELYKEGRIEEIVEHSERDVEITKKLGLKVFPCLFELSKYLYAPFDMISRVKPDGILTLMLNSIKGRIPKKKWVGKEKRRKEKPFFKPGIWNVKFCDPAENLVNVLYKIDQRLASILTNEYKSYEKFSFGYFMWRKLILSTLKVYGNKSSPYYNPMYLNLLEEEVKKFKNSMRRNAVFVNDEICLIPSQDGWRCIVWDGKFCMLVKRDGDNYIVGSFPKPSMVSLYTKNFVERVMKILLKEGKKEAMRYIKNAINRLKEGRIYKNGFIILVTKTKEFNKAVGGSKKLELINKLEKKYGTYKVGKVIQVVMTKDGPVDIEKEPASVDLKYYTNEIENVKNRIIKDLNLEQETLF